MEFRPASPLIFRKDQHLAYIHRNIHSAKLLLWETLWEMCKTMGKSNFYNTVKTLFIHNFVTFRPREFHIAFRLQALGERSFHCSDSFIFEDSPFSNPSDFFSCLESSQ